MNREESKLPEEVKAKKFTLVDERGKTRAVLGVSPEGVGLALADEKGKACAGLSVGPEGPGLALLDEEGCAVFSAP